MTFKYIIYIVLFVMLFCSYSIYADKQMIGSTGLSWEIIKISEPDGSSDGTAKLEISINGENDNLTLPNFLDNAMPPWYGARSKTTSSNDYSGNITWRTSDPAQLGKIKFDDKVYKITKLVLPYGLTSIGAYSFPYLYYLTDLVVPETVTTIGNNAFANCTSLSKIIFLGDPPTVKSDTFSNISSNGNLYVSDTQKFGSLLATLLTSDEDSWSSKNLNNYSYFNQEDIQNLNNSTKISSDGSTVSADLPLSDWEKSLSIYAAKFKRYIGNNSYTDYENIEFSKNEYKIPVNIPGVYEIEKTYKISDKTYSVNKDNGTLALNV